MSKRMTSRQKQFRMWGENALFVVALILGAANAVVVYFMLIVRHVANAGSAMIFAVISTVWIIGGYRLLERLSFPGRWILFLAVGMGITLGMLWFAEWLMLAM